MNTSPPLTVGLPVHNGQKYLRQSLDALLGQTFGDFELIIADNASTDRTAEICREYAARDRRIRYVRQPRNIGSCANHNFLVGEARGGLFKWASDDDLYARDLFQRCVDALDECPQVVLAHSWTAIIDESGTTTSTAAYNLDTASPNPAQRLASLLFASGGDDIYGVIRTDVIRRVGPQGSHYHSDRTFVTRLGLQGPFYQVPDWLYFRRDHRDRVTRTSPTVRSYCVAMDPRRADRLRHPTVRLYGEYVWSYVSAIREASLTSAERWECYRHLAQWLGWRGVSGRGTATACAQTAASGASLSVDALVAGRQPVSL